MLRYILLVLLGEALLHIDAIPTGGKGGGCGGGGCGKGGGGGGGKGGGGGGKGGGGGGKGGGGKGKGLYGTWNRYSSRTGLVPGHDLDYSIYYDKNYQTPGSGYQLGHADQQYRGDVYTRSYQGQYGRSYQIPNTYFHTPSGYEGNHVRDKIAYPTYGYETPLVYQYPQNWLRGYDQGWQTKEGYYQKGHAPLQIPYDDLQGRGERTSLYVRQSIPGEPAFDIGYRAKKNGQDDKSERT